MPQADDENTRDAGPYDSAYHAPVLCKTVVEGLVTKRDGVYVDGTMGGGGHTAALLDALAPGGRVVGIDRDADAIAEARRRLAPAVEAGRLITVHGAFAQLPLWLANLELEHVDGILVDLGVSSHQIDTAARGFSFQASGDLDMRMDVAQDVSAHAIVNTTPQAALADLIYQYGEERRSRRIAERIVMARPLETTAELAEVVRKAVPAREAAKTLARVFQAIRIAVNGELDELEDLLAAAVETLAPDGRLAVISYHSLEDRRVKHFMKFGNLEGAPIHDMYGNLQTPWRLITRKVVKADAHEVATNPRARSARLRIAARK